MAYDKDKTQFRHSSYGTGVFRGYSDGGLLLIEFPGKGVKKFLENSVRSGHLTVITPASAQPTVIVPTAHWAETHPIAADNSNTSTTNNLIADAMELGFTEEEATTFVEACFGTTPTQVIAPVTQSGSTTRQYDSSDTVIGDKNVLEAFDCEDIVLFNESYVVVGAETRARIIRAVYDLTIIGDLVTTEIQVNGSLTVMGNVAAKKINCSNNLFCQGSIAADTIYVGADMIADSVKCGEFLCDGNAVIRTTIDIDKSSRTEKTMVACEGIIGGGTFAAMNAIANEYFEFDGEVEGHVVELETETTLSEMSASRPADAASDFSELSIEEALAKMADRIRSEYARMGKLDEDALLELTQMLSSGSLGELENMGNLFEQLTQISYQDEINDLGDYLVIEYAKKQLPSQLYRYETVEHVDSILLPKAVASLEELEFIPTSVAKIAQSLHIIMQLQGSLPLSSDALCDKVFSSIGLRFSTVKGIMNRTGTVKPTALTAPITETANEASPEAVLQAESLAPGEAEDYKPTPVVIACTNRADFLSKPLSVIGKSFTMTNDEIIRLGSVRIRTVGEFIAVDEAFIRELYKKKPFLANHLITVLKRMKAAKSQIK